MHTSQLSATKRDKALEIGKTMLYGVGEGRSFGAIGDAAIHVRRGLTQAEREILGAEWLAIPATVEAGFEDRTFEL